MALETRARAILRVPSLSLSLSSSMAATPSKLLPSTSPSPPPSLPLLFTLPSRRWCELKGANSRSFEIQDRKLDGRLPPHRNTREAWEIRGRRGEVLDRSPSPRLQSAPFNSRWISWCNKSAATPSRGRVGWKFLADRYKLIRGTIERFVTGQGK